jgi:hypothetical protein
VTYALSRSILQACSGVVQKTPRMLLVVTSEMPWPPANPRRRPVNVTPLKMKMCTQQASRLALRINWFACRPCLGDLHRRSCSWGTEFNSKGCMLPRGIGLRSETLKWAKTSSAYSSDLITSMTLLQPLPIWELPGPLICRGSEVPNMCHSYCQHASVEAADP